MYQSCNFFFFVTFQWKYSRLTLVLLNPDIPCLCKQCRSRSVGFWRSQLIWTALFVILYVNLYQQPGSSNLIGWKLEMGWHLNLFSMTRVNITVSFLSHFSGYCIILSHFSGNVVGYHVKQPCVPCLQSQNNGHYWMFYRSSVIPGSRLTKEGNDRNKLEWAIQGLRGTSEHDHLFSWNKGTWANILGIKGMTLILGNREHGHFESHF